MKFSLNRRIIYTGDLHIRNTFTQIPSISGAPPAAWLRLFGSLKMLFFGVVCYPHPRRLRDYLGTSDPRLVYISYSEIDRSPERGGVSNHIPIRRGCITYCRSHVQLLIPVDYSWADFKHADRTSTGDRGTCLPQIKRYPTSRGNRRDVGLRGCRRD